MGQLKYGDKVCDIPFLELRIHMDTIHHSRYLWHRNGNKVKNLSFFAVLFY